MDAIIRSGFCVRTLLAIAVVLRLVVTFDVFHWVVCRCHRVGIHNGEREKAYNRLTTRACYAILKFHRPLLIHTGYDGFTQPREVATIPNSITSYNSNVATIHSATQAPRRVHQPLGIAAKPMSNNQFTKWLWLQSLIGRPQTGWTVVRMAASTQY